MYIQKKIKTKHRTFITKSKCFYYNPQKAKGRRGIRRYPTGESKQERNRRNANLKRKYQIYNNFDIGDMWITLTYNQDNIPKDGKEAHKTLMAALGKLQRKLKRKNIPLVYYIKTEAGTHCRVHHHLFVKNNFAVIDMLYQLWRGYGKVKDFSQIYGMEDGRLVRYFLSGGDHKELNFEKYSHSRNLKEPEIETRILSAKSFREFPKPPKCDEEGMEYIIENLTNGYTDIDGYTYQEYEITKRKKSEVQKE